MSEYGVTPAGFVKKRLDVIANEIHRDLAAGFGRDTTLNPQSFLNVLVVGISDKLAELWEVAEDTYHSMYPMSAEDVSLDNAVQYAGIKRMPDQHTVYPLLCTGIDGTVIPGGTIVASTTNPSVRFAAARDGTITRTSFNRARIQTLSAQPGAAFTVGINGDLFSYTAGEGAYPDTILAGLRDVLTGSAEYIAEVIDGALEVRDTNPQRNSALLLSENLTTESVSTVISFNSEAFGKIVLPEGTITAIITNVDGFQACTNLVTPIDGRLRETNVELRQSYVKRIAVHSSYMLESITSAILDNVQGVQSITAYENDSNMVDSEGRLPHSVEIIVDGGSDMEIARQILRQKAGGIQTNGVIEVPVPDLFGRVIPIRFNRPAYVYVWLRVSLIVEDSGAVPPNFAELAKAAILDHMGDLSVGVSVYTQKFIGGIYRQVTGVSFVEIAAFSTTDAGTVPEPDDYAEDNILVSSRQKALIEEKRIEVVLRDGSG